MTEAVRVIALCMGAALFSVSLRMHRPELAALFSLAVGVVALWRLREPFAEFVAAVRQLAESSMDGGQTAAIVMGDQLINRPVYGQQRKISDIIYFATAMPEGG